MMKTEILCLGELMLDMVARQAADGSVEGFDMRPGGAAGNVAVAASRLGLRAGILAKVSDDFFGNYMKQVMEKNGVDTSGLILDASRKIAMAFVTFDADKKPSYLFYRENSASASFEKEEISPDVFKGVRALYFSSMGLVREPLRSANYEAARLATNACARVAFDPNIRFGVWPSREAVRSEVLCMMQYTHICKMNDEELAFLFGTGDLETQCRKVLSEYPSMELVAITLGADGAFLMNRVGMQACVGALDHDVVDTVGAGDSFFATLLWYVMHRGFRLQTAEELHEALEYANSAALLTSKRYGAIPAMPRLDEVEKLRTSYKQVN